MPEFLIASLYADRDRDLMGSALSALTPFDALVKNCMGICKVEEWEACQLLETESWDAIVWRIDKGGPVLVTHEKMCFPWRRINDLCDKIVKTNSALTLAGNLEVLAEIPGTNADAIDLAPVHERLVGLKAERTDISDAWAKRKAKPPDNTRQLRSVQVDPPEDENDVVPF